MSFHSFDPSRSWGFIASFVVAIHVSLITLSFFVESSNPPPQEATRFIVQTVDLSSDSQSLLALEPNPLPPNPIKRSPLPPHPIDNIPLPSIPLERKTMKQEPITPARIPEVPPRPAPTLEPEAKESGTEIPATPLTPKAPPPKKPEPIRKSATAPKTAEPAKKVDAKAKKKATSSKKTGPPQPIKKVMVPAKPIPAKTTVPPSKAAEDLKKKQAEEAERQKLEAEAEKKKAELERQQKLLADAQEKMSKIGSKRSPSNATATASSLHSLPSAISDLHVEALPAAKGAPALTSREATYRDELAGRLRLLLKLPEYGEVKISLTLNRSGGVDKVVILSAESSNNKKYIEKMLPTLQFPPFGNNFESLSQYTFNINLSNE